MKALTDQQITHVGRWCFGLFEQVDDIADRPEFPGHTGSHRGRHLQRLMNFHEVESNRVQRDHVAMVLKLLREAEREPSKPSMNVRMLRLERSA
jgi:hypothetical protein